MRMIRKQFYITSEQDARLKRLASEQGLTEAEVVRMALDQIDISLYQNAGEQTQLRIAETALMEYNVDEIRLKHSQDSSSRKDTLAARAWAEEVAFMRSLADSRSSGGTLEKFNRDELYEERLSKILHRHEHPGIRL